VYPPADRMLDRRINQASLIMVNRYLPVPGRLVLPETGKPGALPPFGGSQQSQNCTPKSFAVLTHRQSAVLRADVVT
jgi:hypothetical protein